MPRNPDKTRCTYPGCRAWAMRRTTAEENEGPALCVAHAGRNVGAGAPQGNQNARTHGFYARALTPVEIADAVAYADDLRLDDEIAIARIALRRVLDALATPDDLSTEQLVKLAHLAFQGTRTVARLIRDRHALYGDDDGILDFMAEALDQLSEEWGVEL